VIHVLAPNLDPVEDVGRASTQTISTGTLVGFGFVGLVFGSFVGWCTGLLSHVTGQTLFEYMMIGAAIGIPTGIITGLLINPRFHSA